MSPISLIWILTKEPLCPYTQHPPPPTPLKKVILLESPLLRAVLFRTDRQMESEWLMNSVVIRGFSRFLSRNLWYHLGQFGQFWLTEIQSLISRLMKRLLSQLCTCWRPVLRQTRRFGGETEPWVRAETDPWVRCWDRPVGLVQAFFFQQLLKWLIRLLKLSSEK